MRTAWRAILVTLAIQGWGADAAATGFDPGAEGLVVLNVAVPDGTGTQARLSLRTIELWSAGVGSGFEPDFAELDSRELAGRAPRWAQLRVAPAVLDSLVLRWDDTEVRVDGAWIRPRADRPTVIPLHRRVDRGEVLVLNLAWRPDTFPADDPAWRPAFELEHLAEPPVGGRIYVSEAGAGIVSVFERVSGRMVGAIGTGGQPRDLAWDPVQQRLYVAVAGRDELLVVDVAGRPVVRRIPLSYGADPTRILLTRDRQRVAVLAPGQDQVFLYSAASLQEVARVRVGQAPTAIAEDLRGGRLFVTCRKAGEIVVVDSSDGRNVGRFEGFESPTELLVLGSGRLVVGQDRANRIDLVDPISGAIEGSLRLCGSTAGLLGVERLDRIYVFDDRCSEIAIFRPEQGLEVGTIPLDEPAGLPALVPRGSGMLVPFAASRRVVVLSLDRGDPQLVCEVGPGPWRAIAP